MGGKGACGLHCTKINNISVKFGKEQVLKNVNIHVHCGELTVIIGRKKERRLHLSGRMVQENLHY